MIAIKCNDIIRLKETCNLLWFNYIYHQLLDVISHGLVETIYCNIFGGQLIKCLMEHFMEYLIIETN